VRGWTDGHTWEDGGEKKRRKKTPNKNCRKKKNSKRKAAGSQPNELPDVFKRSTKTLQMNAKKT